MRSSECGMKKSESGKLATAEPVHGGGGQESRKKLRGTELQPTRLPPQVGDWRPPLQGGCASRRDAATAYSLTTSSCRSTTSPVNRSIATCSQ